VIYQVDTVVASHLFAFFIIFFEFLFVFDFILQLQLKMSSPFVAVAQRQAQCNNNSQTFQGMQAQPAQQMNNWTGGPYNHQMQAPPPMPHQQQMYAPLAPAQQAPRFQYNRPPPGKLFKGMICDLRLQRGAAPLPPLPEDSRTESLYIAMNCTSGMSDDGSHEKQDSPSYVANH